MTARAERLVIPPARRRLPTTVVDILLNMSGTIVTSLLLLVTAPAYIAHVGLERYGVLVIVWTMLGYLGFLDLGLSRAAANFSARSTDTRWLGKLFVTVVAFNGATGVAGGLAFALSSHWILTHIVNASPEIHTELLPSSLWIAGFLPFLTVSGVFTGMFEGLKRFGLSNSFQTAGAALFQLVPLAAATLVSPRLDVLIPCALVTRAVCILASGIALIRLTRMTIRQPVDRALLRTLFSFGSWVTVTSIVSPLLTSADQFVISAMSGVRLLPFYSIPSSVVQRANVLPQAVFRALYPRLVQAGGTDGRVMLRTSVLLLGVLLSGMICAALLFVQPGLRLWLGPDFASVSSTVARILLVGIWFNGLAFLPFAYLESMGRPDLPAIFHSCELLPYLLLLGAGIMIAGLEGAAVASAVRMAADAALLFGWAGCGRRLALRLLPGMLLVAAGFLVGEATTNLLLLGVAVLLAGAAWLGWAGFTVRLLKRAEGDVAAEGSA